MADVSWEILVVDDGSTDGTRETVEREFGRQVRLLVSERNAGKGHAVRRGMVAATGDLRVMVDADSAMAPAELPRLLEPLLQQRAEVVIGSRYVTGSKSSGQPWWRHAWSRFTNVLAQRRLVRGIADIHSGYKAFTAGAARELFGRATIDGWAFDLEILALAQRLGLRVLEVPISWRDDPKSKVNPARDLLRELRSAWMLQERFRHWNVATVLEPPLRRSR